MIDAQAFGVELAAIVKAATAPLIARIDALENASSVLPEPGRDGKDADPDVVAALVFDRVKAELETQGDSDPDVMTVDDIKALIVSEVASAVSDLPPAERGNDGRDGADGKDGEKGDPGRDGLDVKDLFRADGGRLVAVMSDGTTKDMGVFVGKDGKDGAPGKDGSDGLGFDDMEFTTDEHGRPVAKFQRGDVVKSIQLPCIIDRGPYRSGETYQKGDAVSYGGGLWIAQDHTSEKPDGGSGWRLAVKAGRSAKSAFDIAKANGFSGTERDWISILSAKSVK